MQVLLPNNYIWESEIKGDPGSVPVLGRSPAEGNGNPLQYSCLENSMNRGAWQATVHGISKESDTTEQLTWIYIAHLKLVWPSTPHNKEAGILQARIQGSVQTDSEKHTFLVLPIAAYFTYLI